MPRNGNKHKTVHSPVTIRRSGEQDTVSIGEKGHTQDIDMSALQGKPRVQATQQFVDWWCIQNGFKPLYGGNQ